jgi:hypothetical protein
MTRTPWRNLHARRGTKRSSWRIWLVAMGAAALLILGATMFFGRAASQRATPSPVANGEPLDQAQVTEGNLKALLEPGEQRPNESWIAGEPLARSLLDGSASGGSLLLLGFLGCKESSVFFVADALQRALQHTPGLAGAVAIALPQPPTEPTKEGPGASSECQSTDFDKGLLSVPIFSDTTFRVWHAFGSPSWPSLMLLDRSSGRILQKWSGLDFVRLWTPASAPNRPKPPTATVSPALLPDFLPLTDLSERLLGQDSLIVGRVAHGSLTYLVDAAGHQIVRSDAQQRASRLIGGIGPGFVDGDTTLAKMRYPHRLVPVAPQGPLVIADWGNHALRTWSPDRGELETLPMPGNAIPHEILALDSTLLVSELLKPRLWIARLAPDAPAEGPVPLGSFQAIDLPGEFAPGILMSVAEDPRIVLLQASRTGLRLALDVDSGELKKIPQETLPQGPALPRSENPLVSEHVTKKNRSNAEAPRPTQRPPMIVKAGSRARITVTITVPQGYTLNPNDPQILMMPTGETRALYPRTTSTFGFDAPLKTGRSAFILKSSICDRKNMGICLSIQEELPLEIRSTFHDAEAQANIKLQL